MKTTDLQEFELMEAVDKLGLEKSIEVLSNIAYEKWAKAEDANAKASTSLYRAAVDGLRVTKELMERARDLNAIPPFRRTK